jgi:DNA-directed RNA polymerase specialized sigma24 family protein
MSDCNLRFSVPSDERRPDLRPPDADPVPSGPKPERGTDRALAAAAAAGSLEHWHRLIERYTPLIHSVLRGHLHNEEDVRTVFAQVLHHLHRGKLAGYEGRSALSTWLVLVARTETFDFLRRRHGRRETPKGVERLGEGDREIFKLFYLEGASLEGVRHRLASRGTPVSGADVLDALNRIEAALGRRVLRRLTYDLSAASTSSASGRLLEFLDHARGELERNSDRRRADHELMEKEAKALMGRVKALVRSLPAEERAVLDLRFGRGLTARRVAGELGLSGPRRVYSLIEKSLRTLRRRLSPNLPNPPG